MMEETALLPLPQKLRLIAIERQGKGLLIQVLSTQMTCRCPLCGAESDAVHSRYHRRLSDLPCAGQPIRLQLTVRKFFCHNPACERRIFTERLPTFVELWAQMTIRLKEAITAVGLATSGSLGTRLSARLGIGTSWMTILRRIMGLPAAPAPCVSVLGIDDFSFKRGRTFGTILVDLSTHQVIELLPERAVESAAAWMQSHPEIEYVSRDRGNDYAQAARDGAPQAQAVADRFHLYKNLVEAIEPAVARRSKEMRKDLPKPIEPQLPSVKEWRPARDPAHEQQHQSRLAANQERFDSMMALQKLGIPQDEIARRLGVTKRTIQNWNKQGSGPGSRRRRKRRSLFDPYAAYVL